MAQQEVYQEAGQGKAHHHQIRSRQVDDKGAPVLCTVLPSSPRHHQQQHIAKDAAEQRQRASNEQRVAERFSERRAVPGDIAFVEHLWGRHGDGAVPLLCQWSRQSIAVVVEMATVPCRYCVSGPKMRSQWWLKWLQYTAFTVSVVQKDDRSGG